MKPFVASWFFAITIAVMAVGCTTVTPRTTDSGLKTRNVFLITTDGLRWQELFTGAEDELLSDTNLNTNPSRIKLLYWRPTPQERRTELFPFFWNTIAKHGQ